MWAIKVPQCLKPGDESILFKKDIVLLAAVLKLK